METTLPISPGRIAVIGAGIAGITAAYLLDRRHQVTLYEKGRSLGGHTHTVVLEDGPDAGTPVDTGFIVYNHRNYPGFIRFLDQLGIQGQSSDMSFSFSGPGGSPEYSSFFPKGLFAQRRNGFRPSFYRMIADILRFNRSAVADLNEDRLGDQTLGDYLERGRYSRPFRRWYLLPMGAAIWSTPLKEMLDFPAKSFIRFFDHHGLLALKGRPKWMTVPGGSHQYIRAFLKGFGGEVRTACGITSVSRSPDKVIVREASGAEETFDHVVIAAHADQALAMLADPSNDEKRLLGVWRYTPNRAVLHSDPSAMPRRKRAWASWNYKMESGGEDAETGVSLTYDMNRLQNLKTERPYFVTLNRQTPVEPSCLIKEIDYRHPSYTRRSYATQAELPNLNGTRRTFFCGSYHGDGFHEDALKASLEVGKHFGEKL